MASKDAHIHGGNNDVTFENTGTVNIANLAVSGGISGSGSIVFKSYTLTTRGIIGAHDAYLAGYYFAPAAAKAFTQAAATQTWGTAITSYAAHAFMVTTNNGAADAGTVSVVVSGTSITDGGVALDADSETIIADVTAAGASEYFETSKKWLGTITYTLTLAGGATTGNITANYGYCKYEDFGNRDFTVTDFECVWETDTSEGTGNFDICFFLHSDAGWTYSLAAFVPGGTVIADMVTDHTDGAANDVTRASEDHAYKRAALAQAVLGSAQEGVVIRVSTTANNSLQHFDAHVGVTF